MNFPTAPEHRIKQSFEPGQVTWQSPSNIALIKYWGKHGNQLPRNPSLSFTLANAYSETTLKYREKADADHKVALQFRLDGQEIPAFASRIEQYLSSLLPAFPFLEQMEIEVLSRNSFPHSSGIASSASGFSALALCLCSLEHYFFNSLEDDQAFRRKASFIARLGSGSACRSIYAQAALWGATGLFEGASNEYAVPFGQNLHANFHNFRDAILLVSREEKSVSSSAGHQLMDHHPYATIRYEEARRHLDQLISCLHRGDLEQFVQICESEAMQLHAMMMASNPYYMLMQPNTVKILQLIREFRKSTDIQACFTLDAGPNVHFLYPAAHAGEVENFIKGVLVPYCHQGAWISDYMGAGPLQIDG